MNVPTWAEIQVNYPRTTETLLTPLLTAFRPGGTGQLILWHEPPGTGKTFALRALAWKWRHWCAVEVFFAAFNGGEAKEWAKRTGRITPASGGTLAELYDLSDRPTRSMPRRVIGF